MDGKRYCLPIHGFAPTSEFYCAEQSRDKLVLELTDSEATRQQYPRAFVFRVIYTLVEKTLQVTYQVENKDSRTMYFGIGGHPGFRVPLVPAKNFEDYTLVFAQESSPRRIGFTESCFLDGTTVPYPLAGGREIPLRHDLFDQDAIVLQDMPHQVTLEADGDTHAVTVTYPQMKYLGIWHMPHTDAPYVCIEPWCSLPAVQDQMTVFEQQADLIRLEAGQQYRNQWSIAISY